MLFNLFNSKLIWRMSSANCHQGLLSWVITRFNQLAGSLAGPWEDSGTPWLLSGDSRPLSREPVCKAPHNMVAGFPESQRGREKAGRKSLFIFATWSWKYLLLYYIWWKQVTRSSPHSRGENDTRAWTASGSYWGLSERPQTTNSNRERAKAEQGQITILLWTYCV